jgi:ribonuclease HII
MTSACHFGCVHFGQVTRDRLMTELDAAHPGYGFAKHKGYGTAVHLAALNSLGPTEHHRRSFAPVAAACAGELAQQAVVQSAVLAPECKP